MYVWFEYGAHIAYDQNKKKLANSDEERRFMYTINRGHLTVFCIVFVSLGGPPSPVRIITQVQRFMYQNQFEHLEVFRIDRNTIDVLTLSKCPLKDPFQNTVPPFFFPSNTDPAQILG